VKLRMSRKSSSVDGIGENNISSMPMTNAASMPSLKVPKVSFRCQRFIDFLSVCYARFVGRFLRLLGSVCGGFRCLCFGGIVFLLGGVTQ